MVVVLGCGGPPGDDPFDRDASAPPADAAAPDAAAADAMVTPSVDATVPDAAIPDAAIPDAAIPDAAIPDAAIPDAAIPDAATPDAPLPDARVPVVTALRILPEEPVLSISHGYPFRALAELDDGSTVDVSSEAIWSTSDGSYVLVGGLVSCLEKGTGTVEASYAGLSASVPLRCHAWDWRLLGTAPHTIDFGGDTETSLFAAWGGFHGEANYAVYANEWTDVVGTIETISIETGDIRDVSVGMNGRGDRHVSWVWRAGDLEQLEAIYKLLGGAWSGIRIVQSLGDTNVSSGRFNVCRTGRTYGHMAGTFFFVPATGWAASTGLAQVVDAFCNGAYVWKSRWLSPVISNAIYVAWSDSSGAWQRTDEVFLHEQGEGVGSVDLPWSPQIGMDVRGNVMVAWVEEHFEYTRLMARRYDQESGWAPAVEISRATPFNFPRLAVGAGGHAVLLWDSYPELVAAYFDPDSGWGPPEVVAGAGGTTNVYSWDIADEVVAVDNDGRGYVIFRESDGDTLYLRVARYHPGLGWTSEVIDWMLDGDPGWDFVHASIFTGFWGRAVIGYVRRAAWEETIYAERFSD